MIRKEQQILSKMYVIGNGFDIYHGFPTKFEHFRKFLIKKYNYDDRFDEIPISQQQMNGDYGYDEDEMVSLFINLIDRFSDNNSDFLWGDFEETLGNIVFDEYIYEGIIQRDDEGDVHIARTGENIELLSDGLNALVEHIKQCFYQWIKKIKILSKPKPEIIDLFNDHNAIFISFNYTETLEKVYLIPPKKVLHVHGKVSDDIVFGHGNAYIDYDSGMVYEYNANGMNARVSNTFRKPTETIISDIFANIDVSHVKEIITFGFSFSKVDMTYFKYIFDMYDSSHMYIYVNSYDSDKIDQIKSKLESVGFRGMIEIYHL